MSRRSKKEYITAKRRRYAEATASRKSRIIDEVVDTVGISRKYAINLLNGNVVFRERKGRGKTYKDNVRPARSKERWSGKTQLAKLIARRGGNEGAFGGILQYFADKGSKVRKPCHSNSKWRKPLEDAGVTFDKADYVKDWEHAKNPI